MLEIFIRQFPQQIKKVQFFNCITEKIFIKKLLIPSHIMIFKICVKPLNFQNPDLYVWFNPYKSFNLLDDIPNYQPYGLPFPNTYSNLKVCLNFDFVNYNWPTPLEACNFLEDRYWHTAFNYNCYYSYSNDFWMYQSYKIKNKNYAIPELNQFLYIWEKNSHNPIFFNDVVLPQSPNKISSILGNSKINILG